MFVVAGMYVCLSTLIFFTFVAEPREVGMDMSDDHNEVRFEDENGREANDDFRRNEGQEPGQPAAQTSESLQRQAEVEDETANPRIGFF